MLFSACQEVLQRQRASEPTVATWSVEALDSLSEPLFTQLVRNPLYTNAYGFAANDLVTYDDSIYAARISAIPSAVPLFFDEDVRSYIELYARRKKDLMERMIGKSAWYYPMIEPVLIAEQLPTVLKHLTMVESAMYLKAASHKSAVGLWQIRPATGVSLGLEVSPHIDQRRDPVASSRAAAIYLGELYKRYEDWYLAVAAYNYGIGNINKAIARATTAGLKRPVTFFELRKYLPAETRNYIPAFVAVVYLYHYQQEHNLRPAYFNLPFSALDTVYVASPSSLAQVSQTYDVGVDVLNFLNPALIRGALPLREEPYPVALPGNQVVANNHYRVVSPIINDSLRVRQAAQVVRRPNRVVPNPERMVPLVHRIEQGNTLAGIAREYGCTVDDLVQWNSLYESIIWSGDDLIVYVPRSAVAGEALVRR